MSALPRSRRQRARESLLYEEAERRGVRIEAVPTRLAHPTDAARQPRLAPGTARRPLLELVRER